MMKKADVVIVGAGPSGASTAFFLRYFRPDCEVYLVERLADDKFSEYHNMCGEAVNSGIKDDIAPLKLDSVLNEIDSIIEVWPGEVQIRSKVRGYIIDRARFLRSVIREYRNLGGVYLTDCVIDFKQKNSGIDIKLSNSGIINAKYLVAADGANSMIRKKVGLNSELRLLLQYLVAKKAEYGSSLVFEYDEKYHGDYKWVFPNGDNTKIGFPYIRLRNMAPRSDILKKQARSVAFGGVRDYVLRNVLLVGDAAGQNNPLTKGGIRPGMVAGRMAAKAIADKDPMQYDRAWKSSDFGSTIFIKAYNKVKRMDNKELEHHAKILAEQGSFSWIKILLFYNSYLEIYNAYDISSKVGW
jgi:flavin-dependent dehydrogenase